jgi:hypothetical protein
LEADMPLAPPFRSLVGALFALALLAPAARAAVVINEVDYDQPGPNDTAEFIELKNNGPGPVNLGTYTIELVNGAGGGAAIYQIVALPPVNLAAGAYWVVCFGYGNVVGCSMAATPSVNAIQNGTPDAIGLRDGTTLVDAVSYEGNTGAPYVEGMGFAGGDDDITYGLGISRFPDGVDTNDNNADWSARCISPGQANGPTTSGCVVAVPGRANFWGTLKSMYR